MIIIDIQGITWWISIKGRCYLRFAFSPQKKDEAYQKDMPRV